MFIMNKRLIANPQEEGAPRDMWTKDNDRQFIKKEIQTSIKQAYNPGKCILKPQGGAPGWHSG